MTAPLQAADSPTVGGDSRAQNQLLCFVQAFGIDSPGGGSRILRSLLRDAPVEILSINASWIPTPLAHSVREIPLPYRPWLGRIETTRFSTYCQHLNGCFLGRFRRRLSATCLQQHVTALHSIAHNWDCFAAYDVASRLGTPFYVSVHDHFSCTLRHSGASWALKRFRTIWQNANARFAISDELAKEYCDRYGARPYTLITDGVDKPVHSPRASVTNRLHVYFMGLFHIGYTENFRGLLSALGAIAAREPQCEVTLTCRCGALPALSIPSGVNIRTLPFTTSETELAADLDAADLLYLPLHFSKVNFTRYSLSTKMITYLGSGIPILYHGPEDAAAAHLLRRHEAALFCHTPDPVHLSEVLMASPEKRYSVALSALALARSQFDLSAIRSRFWNSLCSNGGASTHDQLTATHSEPAAPLRTAT